MGTEFSNFWDLDKDWDWFFKIMGLGWIFQNNIFGIGIPRIPWDCLGFGSNFVIELEIWKLWDRNWDCDWISKFSGLGSGPGVGACLKIVGSRLRSVTQKRNQRQFLGYARLHKNSFFPNLGLGFLCLSFGGLWKFW